MGMVALVRSAFPAGVLCVLLHAQARAPFTGTVRDEAGKPLANAEVTCVFVPDRGAPGAPDRATAKTSAEGCFAMQLLVGCAYTVWAIGPAGERGSRSVVWPRPDGAGGRTLDLAADERREPARLKVSGTVPWMTDGPPTLRLFVAGSCPLGPDFVIPGDGLLSLPPLPTAQIGVALFDGKGAWIQALKCDLDADSAVTFDAPREIAFEAHDGDGKPLAGVQILQRTGPPAPALDRLGDRYATGMPALHLLAVTGSDGTAIGRVAGDAGMLCGRLPGHADSWAGWVSGCRVQDGRETPDDGPLTFVLRPAGLRTLRVQGLAEGQRAEVWFGSSAWWRFKNGAGGMTYVLPSRDAADVTGAADGAADGAPVYARVRLVCDSAVPRRLAVVSYGNSAQLADVDLARLRKFALTMVDAQGHPVPGVTVGVGSPPEGWGGGWLDRFVTDGEGRAELWVDDQTGWFVYATTGKASAAHLISTADPAGSVVLELQALATMRLHVVDGEGHPVRGARPEFVGGSMGGSVEVMDKALDSIASATHASVLALQYSNAAGELELPFLERQRVSSRFKVLAGKRVSGDIVLRAGAEVQEITIK
jgi:hypothetical protein